MNVTYTVGAEREANERVAQPAAAAECRRRAREKHGPCRDEPGQVQQRDKGRRARGPRRTTAERIRALCGELVERLPPCPALAGPRPLTMSTIITNAAPPSTRKGNTHSPTRAARCASRSAQARDDARHAHALGVQELGRRQVRPDRNRSSRVSSASRATIRCAPSCSTTAVSACQSDSLRPGGATTARQFSSSTSSPCSINVGTSERRSRSAAGRRHADGAQAARLDVLGELAVAADAGRHLSAEERRHRFAAAGERDVVGPSRIDVRCGDDQAREDVVGAAGGAAAPGHGRRILAERADEALHVAVRRRRRHGDDFVLAGEPRDRRDLGDRDRRLVPEDGAEHHEAVDEQRFAIAAPAVDELRQADRSRRARARSRPGPPRPAAASRSRAASRGRAGPIRHRAPPAR